MLSNKRSATNIFKFIASLLVVNGHIFMYYSDMPKVTSWINIGAQLVSLFLFFSAYGLMSAYEKKGDSYLKDFMSRRIGRIFFPFVLSYIFSLFIYACFKGEVNYYDVITTLYWGGPYVKFSWYVTELAILYLFFLYVQNLIRI